MQPLIRRGRSLRRSRLGHSRTGNGHHDDFGRTGTGPRHRHTDNLGLGRAGNRHQSRGGRLGDGIVGLLLAAGSREQQAAQGSDRGSGTHFSPLKVGAGWAAWGNALGGWFVPVSGAEVGHWAGDLLLRVPFRWC